MGRESKLCFALHFHLRDVRHGKSDAFKFSDSLHWLYQNHPKTLIANLRHIPRTGYWKDLLNFLVRIVVGEKDYQEEVKRIIKCDTTRMLKKEIQNKREEKWKEVLVKANKMWAAKPGIESSSRHRPIFAMLFKKQLMVRHNINPLTGKPWSNRSQRRRRSIHRKVQDIRNGVPPRNPEEIREEVIALGEQSKLEAAFMRYTKRRYQAVRASNTFMMNRVYRAVHIEVARLFAQALTNDLAKMQKCASSPEEAKKKENFCSLASKWAPDVRCTSR